MMAIKQRLAILVLLFSILNLTLARVIVRRDDSADAGNNNNAAASENGGQHQGKPWAGHRPRYYKNWGGIPIQLKQQTNPDTISLPAPINPIISTVTITVTATATATPTEFQSPPPTTKPPPPVPAVKAVADNDHNNQLQSQSTSAPTTPPPAHESADASGMLQLHNDYRASVGMPPMTWNATIADIAKSYAEKCVWEHSHGKIGPFGENLASGASSVPGSIYALKDGFGSWVGEDKSGVLNHYSQVVWRESIQLGCAEVQCNKDLVNGMGDWVSQSFIVCEYFPQGNVAGLEKKNLPL